MRTFCTLLALVWHVCAAAADPDGAAKNFSQFYYPPEVVQVLGGWAGDDSGVTKPRVERVMDEAAWRTLWSQHDLLHDPPKVDFATTMVVAIFSGKADASLYGMHLDSVIKTGGHIELVSGVFLSDVVHEDTVSLYLFVVLPRSKDAISVYQRLAGIMMPESHYSTLAELPDVQ
jgi:hypothetical protein